MHRHGSAFSPPVRDTVRDLGVSVPAAGTLTSAFALGMIVGAPLTALLGRRRPARRTLLVFLGVFLLAHVVGALTSGFAVLPATRVLAAVADAGLLAVGLAAATERVAPDAKGRATSIPLGGTALACVTGVPADAALGRLLGRRSAFWAVALLCAPALAAITRSLPGGRSAPERPGTGARAELRALRRRRLLLALGLGALVNGATFCTFTYLAPLTTQVTGLAAGWVPGLLALFGADAFAGVTSAGRLADRRPLPVLRAGGAALLVGWVLLALAAGHTTATVLLVPLPDCWRSASVRR